MSLPKLISNWRPGTMYSGVKQGEFYSLEVHCAQQAWKNERDMNRGLCPSVVSCLTTPLGPPASSQSKARNPTNVHAGACVVWMGAAGMLCSAQEGPLLHAWRRPGWGEPGPGDMMPGQGKRGQVLYDMQLSYGDLCHMQGSQLIPE